MENAIPQTKEKQARRPQPIGKSLRAIFWKALVFTMVIYTLQRKDISFDLHLNAIPNSGYFYNFFGYNGQEPAGETAAGIPVRTQTHSPKETWLPSVKPMNTSLLAVTPQTKRSESEPSGMKENLANTYDNLVFSSSDYATSDSKNEATAKRKKQMNYVKRFEKVARAEMKKYGIPASISLAQGLLESNAGESRLARKNNNHFGIKCFSKNCQSGHCSNFTDDHHKDFFRKYRSAWESYRAHSLLLQSKRYKSLLDLNPRDYKGWAKGLKKAGYATDRHYAEKLIELIESLRLHQYDE